MAVSDRVPGAESGKRSPAKHLFGFNRVSGSKGNPGQPSSVAIKSRNAIQKHTAVRVHEFEEEAEVVVADVGMDEDFAGAIHEADVHLAGVEIDSAVEFRGGGIILHGV